MNKLLKQAQQFYSDEINDYTFYSALADQQKNPSLKKNLLRIAKIEKIHAEFWKKFIIDCKGEIESVKIRKRKIWLVKAVGSVFGPRLAVYLSELGEKSGKIVYHDFLTTYRNSLRKDEQKKIHAIIIDEMSHESFFEEEAKGIPLTNIRDIVLGMNDGLVEILGAVAGLAAVYPLNPFIVAISGSIVGMAGALSMGIGNFIAVRSQRQYDESKKEELCILMDINPKLAAKEVEERLKEADFPKSIIDKVKDKLAEVKKGSVCHIDSAQTAKGEFKAGALTGVAYLIGVLFPVLPFFIAGHSFIALPFSFLLAGIALGITAISLSLISHLSWKKKIVEMVMAAFIAAGLSYGFGKMVQILTGFGV